MTDQLADRITGAAGLFLASVYVGYARSIEDSMLSDSVGASGVPVAVGTILLIASLLLFLKSWLPASSPAAPEKPATGASQEPSHPHLKAAGLLAILIAYLVLLPVLGYSIAVGLLVAAAAWFSGARHWRPLLVCMVLSGPILWLMFDWALQIRMPVSSLLHTLAF